MVQKVVSCEHGSVLILGVVAPFGCLQIGEETRETRREKELGMP